MSAYLIRRLLLVIPTLWAIITINFLSSRSPRRSGGPAIAAIEFGHAGGMPGGGGEGMGPAMPGRAWATSAKATTGAVGDWIRR